MIRLMDNWAIKSADMCYLLGEVKVRPNRNGEPEELFVTHGYYSSIESALTGLRKNLHLEAIKDYDGDLDGAIRKLRGMDREFTEKVKEVVGDA